MHSVCRCGLPVWRRSFLRKGTPGDLFLPLPGSAPGRIWPKNNNTCKGPWVLNPYQVSSKSIQRFWRRSRKCEKFTDRRQQRTTDGRQTVRYDNSSLVPSAQVSLKSQISNKELVALELSCWFSFCQEFFKVPVSILVTFPVKNMIMNVLRTFLLWVHIYL